MITERLAATLTTTNDWLKFAEAKLTVLITINAAAAFAAAQLLTVERFPPYVALAVVPYLAITSVAIVLTLLGIVPQMKIPPYFADPNQRLDDNLLFYGDAAKYEPDDYVKGFCALMGQPASASTRYDRALACQIIVNSKICMGKFRVFSWAIRATVYAILVFLEVVLLGMLTPLY